MQLDNKAVGEIIEINEKNAVIALGGLMTTVKVERLSKISNSAAKKITQNRTPRPSSNSPGKHQPETHGFQTGDRRTRTTGRRGAHESIGIH